MSASLKATPARMLRRRPSLTAILAVGVLAGCGFDRPAAASLWSITVDTLESGAVRVAHEPPADGIEATWVVEEELRIGALDGDGPTSFGQIKGLVVDDAGRIVVLESQAQELRVFGPDGGYLRTLGRRGEGPGEMRNANGILLTPDGRVRVVDPQLGRVSVFDIDAGFVESFPWQVRQWGWVFDGVLDEAGRLLVPSNAQVDGERWHTLRVYSPSMEPLDSILLQKAAPMSQTDAPGAFRWESGGSWGFVQVPFYAQAQRVLAGGPAFWGTEAGDTSYRVRRWTAGGDTTLVVESRRPPLTVSAAQRDSAIAHIRDFIRDRGADTRQDWSKIPDTRPAVLGLSLSEAGDLWVRAAVPAEGVTTWDVYAPDGRYRGTAVGALEVHPWVKPVVRGDLFWAVVTDDLDVQYVVAGRLAAPAAF
jgi:hypothetical protein